MFFYKMIKIPKNSAKQLTFWLILQSFWITLSYYALAVMPQFLYQMKGLMEMHHLGTFHLYSIFGCEV